MENRRRKKWDNIKKSHNRKPPRGSWQPRVPSWEKEFCKVVGSLDWETLLQMKKFTHLYEDVINWNDSAGEEAFFNAKKRFQAEINGLYCDILLPDPNLYIDEINWDSEPDPELLSELECKPVISNTLENHDPVIIFGDSLFPNEAYSPTGWGDNEDDFKVQANSLAVNQVEPWEQNWLGPFDNQDAVGWPVYSNTGWHMNDGSGNVDYATWGVGWNDDGDWNYPNNNLSCNVGPDNKGKGADWEQGMWNNDSVARVDAGRYVSSHRPSVVQWHDEGPPKMADWGEQSGVERGPASREWNSFNSCAPLGHHAGIAIGHAWNQ